MGRLLFGVLYFPSPYGCVQYRLISVHETKFVYTHREHFSYAVVTSQRTAREGEMSDARELGGKQVQELLI